MPYVQYRSQFDQAPSIRQRIIDDDETTSLLLEMVEISHNILTKDSKYEVLRNLLAETVTRTPNLNDELRKVRKQELFSGVSCGGTDDVVGLGENGAEFNQYVSTRFITGAEVRTMNMILNEFEIEILRFLAMKILLEHIPSAQGNPYDSTRALHDDSSNDPRSPPMSPVSIIPSKCLKEGWKNVSQLPLLYSDICIAMGSEGPIDIDSEEINLRYDGTGDPESDRIVKMARDNYRYTLDTYEKVYLIVPAARFWLRLSFACDGEEERENEVLCDDFSDILEWMVVKVKESVNGKEDRMPNAVEFEKDLYMV